MAFVKYLSTRGGAEMVSFKQAILSGHAPDGGLYMPQRLPSFTVEELKAMATLSYTQLAKKLFRYFVSAEEIPDQDYNGIFDRAFSNITHADVLPITTVNGVNILEMWHGPSGSLKDFSLNIISQFINYFTKQDNTKTVGVVGTLGDTGCAAIQNCLGLDCIRLVVMFPSGGVSQIQRLSMTTVHDPYIRVYSCECDTDVFDTDIEQVFTDTEFAKRFNLTWLNSINIGRVLSHVVYHVYSYLKLCPEADRELSVYIPTGGMGNIAGGCIAQHMGLPVKLTAVVNENDCLHRCVTTGVLQRNSELVNTHACAIDSLTVTNLERVLYLLTQGDATRVKDIMTTYKSGQGAEVPVSLFTDSIRTIRVDQQKAIDTAKTLWSNHQYMVCPHTAVCISGAITDTQPPLQLCHSTATPAKFPAFVKAVDPDAVMPTHPLVEGIRDKRERNLEMKVGGDWQEILRTCIQELYDTQ